MAGAGEIDESERDRRIGDVEDRLHPFVVVPSARDVEADIHLVLVIGDEHLDLAAQNLAAEILDRHLRRLHGARAGQIGVGAGLVVHDADGEDALGEGGAYQQAEGEGEREAHGIPTFGRPRSSRSAARP
jgi:hypothetical protein